MKIGYYAVFNFDEVDEIEYGIGVEFPNVDGSYTCARNIEEVKNLLEVLELVTYDIKVSELPRVSTIEEIKKYKKITKKIFWIEYETSETNVIEFDKNL